MKINIKKYFSLIVSYSLSKKPWFLRLSITYFKNWFFTKIIKKNIILIQK